MADYYSKDSVISEVISQIIKRADQGMEKFGQPIEDAPGDPMHWLDNAIEEVLDCAVYLVKMKRVMYTVKKLVRIAPDDLYVAKKPGTIMSCPCASCIRK